MLRSGCSRRERNPVEKYWRRREIDPDFVDFLGKMVEAAGVGLPLISDSLIIQEHRSARPARNARKPWSRYKTGTVRRRRQTAPARVCRTGDSTLTGLLPPAPSS